MFFPFKQPIKAASFGEDQFVIIFSRYHNSDDNLMHIKTIIEFHRESETSFFVVMNLVPGNSVRDVQSILEYFSQSGFEIHYLVLSSSWYDKKMISAADMELFEETAENATVHLLDRVVTKSSQRFNERIEEVKDTVVKVLKKKRGYF
ncbi:hypothetical protein [Chitinophaga sp.]|uniref:hypothetical protein n=1 Tax=Chitinophaga sp. TaxID=1869181 RepID=UPI002F9576F3